MSPGDTRTAILDLAEELLRTRSFNSFSYQDIAAEIGIRKASIHYHFPGKEDLGVALIERFRLRAGAWASRMVERNATPAEKLEAYFQAQFEILRDEGKICAQGILSAEFNALPERMKESYMEFLEEQQQWLVRVLGKGQELGLFADDRTPEELAALIQSAMQGSLQIARASGRPERFQAVAEELVRRIFTAPETVSLPDAAAS
jgi:TetR/AcrR family transcriptional repressor of nem operon